MSCVKIAIFTTTTTYTPATTNLNAKINQTNKTTLKCDKQKAEIKKKQKIIIFSRNEKQKKKTQLQNNQLHLKHIHEKAKTNKQNTFVYILTFLKQILVQNVSSWTT